MTTAVTGEWPATDNAESYMREARRQLRANGVTYDQAGQHILWMGRDSYRACFNWLQHTGSITCEYVLILLDNSLDPDAIELAKRTRAKP